MTVCTDCCATEQGTKMIEEDGEEIEVCAVCEMPDTMKNIDEDCGRER